MPTHLKQAQLFQQSAVLNLTTQLHKMDWRKVWNLLERPDIQSSTPLEQVIYNCIS